MLAFRELALTRGGHLLLQGLDAQVPPGQGLLVQGPNGAGKSTLLRAACGLKRPAAGQVHWQGRPLPMNGDALREALAYLGHHDGLHEQLTAVENLHVLLAAGGESPGPQALDEALAQVGLGPWRDRPVRTLSQGQRRRAALARFLVTRKRLWVLDEPLSALDGDGQAAFKDCVIRHLQGGGLALLTCHTDSWPHTPSLARLPLPLPTSAATSLH